MKRRKKTYLPRLVVMAMSGKELLAFVNAVEQLQYRVNDLVAVVDQLERASTKKRKPVPPPAAEGGGS